VSGRAPEADRRGRRRARWFGRAGGALLISALAHAAAAVTVGVVWRAAPPASAAAEPETVDVDLGAPAAPADNGGPPPATSPDQPEAARPRRAARSRRASVAPSAASSPVPAPDGVEAPMRFVLAAGTVATSPPAGRAGAGAGAAAGASDAGDALPEGDVSVPARLLTSSPLVYPAAARNAEIEIDLPVEIVVDTEGRVISARALTRAGYGLDDAALRAIRAYRFSPALRQGRPVRVRMRWTVQFRLR
jgi:protein TonB